MLRTLLAATAALLLTAAAASAQGTPAAEGGPAQAGADQGQPAGPLNAHQRLSLGKSQLQQAAMRLQRAKDTAGADAIGPGDLDEARKIAAAGLDQVNGALKELQQAGNSDAAQQAIRNARLELQSAQTALQGMEAEAPDATIQALKDLDRAAGEVEETTQVAAGR